MPTKRPPRPHNNKSHKKDTNNKPNGFSSTSVSSMVASKATGGGGSSNRSVVSEWSSSAADSPRSDESPLLLTSTSSATASKKRTPCGTCQACTLSSDCGDCGQCAARLKWGSRLGSSAGCVMRECMAPILIQSADCAECKEGESAGTLMECSLCYTIVHPVCIGHKVLIQKTKNIQNFKAIYFGTMFLFLPGESPNNRDCE
jgi:hypothetical protein